MSTPEETESNPTPDALIIPHSAGEGRSRSSVPNLDKTRRILGIAEPILGVDRSKGGLGYIRNQRNQQQYFITKSPTDGLKHANGTPLEGRPRYRWKQVGEYQYGYLLDDTGEDPTA